MTDTWYCGACDMADLKCMNRERMDGVRCCRRCDGHGIPITDEGRAFLIVRGHGDGDGITLLQFMVQMEREGK